MFYIVHNTNYALNDRMSTLMRQNFDNVSDIRLEDESVPGSGVTAAAWASGQTIMTLCDMYDGKLFTDNDAIIFTWDKDYGIKVANDLNVEHDVEPIILYAFVETHDRLIISDGSLEYNLTDLAKYA